MTPFFSIVIPTYNRAISVAAAVRSVLAQTEPDFECFIIDDGSTDGTPEILSCFKDPRLHVILNKDNRGQHKCRNQAIREAKSDWICFLDSDDLFLPPRLAKLRQAISRRPDIGFWFTNAYIHRYGRIIGDLFDPNRAIPEGRVPGHYAIGDSYLPYVTTTVCIRRSAFLNTGFFREDMRILEDTELYARMLKDGLPVGVIREPLAVRFMHEGQITRDYQMDFLESMEALRVSGASRKTVTTEHKRVVLDVATCLWKSLEPCQARKLLLKELGAASRRLSLYWKTFIPSALLWLGKMLRRAFLSVRYHRVFASSRTRDVYKIIQSFY